MKGKIDRIEDLEQQVAQLRWRRMQNERMIKDSLESTKVLKNKDTILGLTSDRNIDKSLWMSSVVKDELARPLVVTDEELTHAKYDDQKVRIRLAKYASSQLNTVDQLSNMLQSRPCRTKDGKIILQQQLKNFEDIKEKINKNIEDINNTVPPIVNLKKGVTYPQRKY
eukprot:gene12930-17331_t